uniref:Metalloendopeptidase n=2 Tax=Strongyloides stercoralis TaxID=6248 RepID=A0AAF5CZ99_STRER
MKSFNYIFISIIILFILIVKLWIKKKNLPPGKIIVRSDKIFTDYYIDFKRDIKVNLTNPWISPIKYSVQPPVDEANIKVAIKVLENNTCVKFKIENEIPKNESGIIFKEGSYCASNVGKRYANHSQEITLTKECQKDPYIILHELGHALGLVHEHARKDRNKYISVDQSQLNTDGLNNFQISTHDSYVEFNTDYDYASLMHYGPYTFGSWWYWLWGWKVMTSRLNEQYDRMMGQRKKMTFNDLKRINLCYCNWCNWVENGTNYQHPNRTTWCKNDGYPDFDNCSRCICPTGYTGNLCEKVMDSNPKCNKTHYIANENVTTLIFNDKMNCYIFIEARLCWRIEIKVLYVNAPYHDEICTEDIAYQFKYREDKGATGLLLCGHHQKYMTLRSETNTSLIIYKGIEPHSFFIHIDNKTLANKQKFTSWFHINSDVVFTDYYIDFKRDIRKNQSDPWIFPIRYYVQSSEMEKNLNIAMSILNNNTCVTFKKEFQTFNDTQGLIFREDSYCTSFIGNVFENHSQIVTLSKDCYRDPYIILHELGHALGLVHEHTRKDRDKFIKIHYNRLNERGKQNFEIRDFSYYYNYLTTYDYAALMHYTAYSFATAWYKFFGYPVMEPKLNEQYIHMMGQRKKMTFNEFKRINLCHCNWCKWVSNYTGEIYSNKKTPCKNGGYADFRNCSKCICPTGYTGDLCQKIIPSDSECGNTSFVANRKGTSLIYNNNMTCHIFINATEGKKIEITILYVNAPVKKRLCTEDIAYQFKYMKDKGTTGLLLCGHHQKHMKLTSESDSVLKLWITNTNLPRGYIVVNSDKIFTDYHSDFKRDIRKNRHDPWIFPIRYYIQSPQLEKNLIIAMSILNNNTCVKFKKEFYFFNDTQGLIFKEDFYCTSFIGNKFKNHPQTVTLSKDCYTDPYIILHELGHALGLVHEHSRKDRDKYVTINYDRMAHKGKDKFSIHNSSYYHNYLTTYDYASIMHYEPYSFVSFWNYLFGRPVMEPKLNEQYIHMMGQTKKMTFNDFKRINLCHCNWCGWVSNRTSKILKNRKTPCKNGGYPDFRNCKRCLCPTGYTGKFCQKIIPSDPKCGRTSFVANKNGTSLIYNNNMTCHIFIKVAKKKKIAITILYVNAPVKQKYCTEDIAYQFKYMRDKGTTGLLLCGHHQKHIKLTSESDSVLNTMMNSDTFSNKHWIINKKLPRGYIIVNNDLSFTDDHIMFKREIWVNKRNPWKFPIKYCVKSPVPKENVKTAISEVQSNTCVTFEEVERIQKYTQGLIFEEGSSCSSYNVIINPYSILHELGHALGLVHEHARIGRDNFIDIDFWQLDKSAKKNFVIYNSSNFVNYSTSYDYASIMHYDQYAFGSWWYWFIGRPVIRPKLDYQYSRMMGQRKKITFNEIKKINLCYCNACGWVNNDTGQLNPDRKPNCSYSGYADFRNCSKCICPTGYTGDLCRKIIPSDPECGNTTFEVNKTRIQLIFNNKRNCYISLKATKPKKIELIIVYVNAPYDGDTCTEDIAYQIKYRRDRGATGLLLCGHHQIPIKLKSETSSILIHYKGIDPHSLLIFQYKEAD